MKKLIVTRGLILLVLAFPAWVAQLTGEVVAIADGDTLTLLVDRTQHKIRLAEIDTPESGQPWGNRARQALADKVFRKPVRVEVVDVDRYDRKVGKIWLGDRDINRELVREGHAWVYRRYMTDRTLLDDERAAQAVSAGLWALPDPIAPWEWRRGQRSAEPVSDAPGACNIKGNINREGARIYHMPGQRHYEQTQIDTTKSERWFCSPREAEQSGWRAARQ